MMIKKEEQKKVKEKPSGKLWRVTVDLSSFDMCVCAETAEEAQRVAQANAKEEMETWGLEHLLSAGEAIPLKSPEEFAGTLPWGVNNNLRTDDWFREGV